MPISPRRTGVWRSSSGRAESAVREAVGHLSELDPQAHIVVHCRSGSRSANHAILSDRLRAALAAIDAANGGDPHTILLRGERRPKELAHAELVSEWIEKLAPGASEALRIAGRAHHLRRWVIPRADYPQGREGYLRWRRALHDFHAEQTAAILDACGYDAALIRRVSDLLHKRGLARRESEAQVLEDALCLVFLETQYREIAERLSEEKLLDVTAKTLRKMSERAKALALELPLDARDAATIRRAAGLSIPLAKESFRGRS